MAGPIIRMKAMIALTGLSRATIYNRMDKESGSYDATFPMSISLGGSAVGWFKDAVDAWLESRGKNEPVDTQSDGNKKHSIPKPTTSPVLSKSKSISTPASLNQAVLNINPEPVPLYQPTNPYEQLFHCGNQIGYLGDCLRLDAWTPTMAALLASGIKAVPGCCEIPLGGEGVDGQSLHASNSRFHQARSILKRWNAQNIYEADDPGPSADAPPSVISPVDFFIWCDEEQISTDWLRLIKEIAGCPDPDGVRYIPTSAALQISRSTQSSGLFSNTENDSAQSTQRASIQNGLLENSPTHRELVIQTKSERNARLLARHRSLRSQGVHNYNQVMAREEGLSKTSIKNLVKDAIKAEGNSKKKQRQ